MSGFDQGDRFERLQGDLRRLKKERDRLKERLAGWTLLHGKEKARVRELERAEEYWHNRALLAERDDHRDYHPIDEVDDELRAAAREREEP